MNKQEHLEKIKHILNLFIKKYKLNINYLRIEGSVYANSYSSLQVKSLHEFDNYTIKEFNHIRSKLYNYIRNYLEKNDIKDIVYITNIPPKSWCQVGIEIYFKESITIR